MASADLAQMTRGLSHSLGRYKLKFSPDKVDVMIVQAIGMLLLLLLPLLHSHSVGLMDDLDKEINNYAMRVKEWYGWHFPELARLVSDNVLYARICKLLRQRSNIKQVREDERERENPFVCFVLFCHFSTLVMFGFGFAVHLHLHLVLNLQWFVLHVISCFFFFFLFVSVCLVL
jgi:hypothetical protein